MTKEQFLEKSKEILGEQGGVMGEGLFRVFDEDNRKVIYCKIVTRKDCDCCFNKHLPAH